MRTEIVALPLSFGPVDHADCPLDSRFAQIHRQRVIVTPGEQEPDTLCGMEQCLVAAGERRANALTLGRRSPIGGGGNAAVMRGKANQYCIVAVFLTCELAYIELGALTQRRAAGKLNRSMRPSIWLELNATR